MTASVGTTPPFTYRHNATRSLRATATIMILRIRPAILPARSRNHRLSALSGWYRSQSQASSIMVVRTRALPALLMP